ncbi:MAG TPA: glycosyltransferase [Urbifossiella sp.]|nr:glycosyltransferase [Urbifossiella sp.]
MPPDPAGVAWVRVPSDERHLARSVSALAALDLLVAGNDLLTHLAGAMGVTVWVVLSEGEAPAWAGGAESTPWYPSTRLFRPGPRGTSALWARITEELHAVAAGDRFRLRTLHRYVAGHALSREAGSPGAPRVSVVMPVWNAARHLPRALASLRGQTCPDWELLAVDDGSDDPSPALLRAAARDDPRVVALCLPANRGPAAARNAALRRARGEWVTYLDSDDAFEPGHLARLARPGIEADVLVFAYDVYEDPGDGPPRFSHTWDPVFKRDRLHVRNPCTPLGLAHRRSLLGLAGLFDERVAYQEDWNLWKRLAASGAVFGFTPERSGRYHRRPDGLAATRRRPTNAPREPGTSW